MCWLKGLTPETLTKRLQLRKLRDRQASEPTKVNLKTVGDIYSSMRWFNRKWAMRLLPPQSTKFSPQAGIAIGPILFILAILALLAAVMSSGNGDYQVASGADRITADIVAQANLIRGTINQCNMQYSLAISTGSVEPSSDPYPASDLSNGTTANALVCSPLGTTSLWSDKLLPPPTQGFSPWSYIDASAENGGRCIWTAPTSPNPKANEAVTSGLTRAATKFNSAPAFSLSNEVIYDPASTSQKFVVWVTLPSGTPDSHCLP